MESQRWSRKSDFGGTQLVKTLRVHCTETIMSSYNRTIVEVSLERPEGRWIMIVRLPFESAAMLVR